MAWLNEPTFVHWCGMTQGDIESRPMPITDLNKCSSLRYRRRSPSG
jgi:hypothetical protein